MSSVSTSRCSILPPVSRIGYIPEDEIRRASCRAFNMYIAHQFGEFSDRMTPAAAIPMHTPHEAVDELEYVVKELGLKVVVMTSMVPRPDSGAPQSARRGPQASRRGPTSSASTVHITTMRYGRSASS